MKHQKELKGDAVRLDAEEEEEEEEEQEEEEEVEGLPLFQHKTKA